MASNAASARRSRSLCRTGWLPLVAAGVVAAALAVGCATDGGDAARDAAGDVARPVDGAERPRPPDARHDATTLLPCDTPGAPCRSDDSCAITTQCGEDSLCHAVKLQDCDDDLPCTRDICLGRGLCDHETTFGSCLIPPSIDQPARCAVEEEANPDNPCQRCRPNFKRDGWTGISGQSCDDEDPCTDSDRCVDGNCRGIYFGHECADEFDCTEDRCLTKDERDESGTRCDRILHPIRDGWCKAPDVLSAGAPPSCFPAGDVSEDGCWVCDPGLNKLTLTNLRAAPGTFCSVDGKCYADGSTDSSGCWVCDVGQFTDRLVRREDVCEIEGLCYAGGALHPGGCAVCDAERDASAWTISAGQCLIGGACYTDGEQDQWCQICDADEGADRWSIVTGACFIDGQCRSIAEMAFSDPSCGACDPAADALSWSASGDHCLIDGECHASGRPTTAFGSCASCTPGASKTDWVLDADECLIDGLCVGLFQSGVSATSGCLVCDPNTLRDWKDAPLVSKETFGFEDGDLPAGWSATSGDKRVRWQVSSRRADGDGRYALYYGDPTRGSFDTGARNSGRVTMAPVTLTLNEDALLHFRLYWDVGTSRDRLSVWNGTDRLFWGTAFNHPTRRWQTILVDLSRYRWAGRNTIQLVFEFDTEDERENGGEGVFIDDIRIYHDCK